MNTTIVFRVTSCVAVLRVYSCFELGSPASSRHFVVGETLKGIRRAVGTVQHGKAPLLTPDIRRIVKSSPRRLTGTVIARSF